MGRAPWAAPCSQATARARGGAWAAAGPCGACPWGTSARSSGGRPGGRPPRHGGAGAGGGSGGGPGGAARAGAGGSCAAPSASCPLLR